MKTRAGVWVDTEKAVVISLEENEHQMNIVQPQTGKRMRKMPKSPRNFHSIICSMIEKHMRLPGDSKEFSKSGPHHFSTELKNEHRLKNEKNNYLKNIIDEIKDIDEVVLFGPSIAKRELEAMMMKNPNLQSHLKGVESADNMTDNQMMRWVENYFTTTRH